MTRRRKRHASRKLALAASVREARELSAPLHVFLDDEQMGIRFKRVGLLPILGIVCIVSTIAYALGGLWVTIWSLWSSLTILFGKKTLGGKWLDFGRALATGLGCALGIGVLSTAVPDSQTGFVAGLAGTAGLQALWFFIYPKEIRGVTMLVSSTLLQPITQMLYLTAIAAGIRYIRGGASYRWLILIAVYLVASVTSRHLARWTHAPYKVVEQAGDWIRLLLFIGFFLGGFADSLWLFAGWVWLGSVVGNVASYVFATRLRSAVVAMHPVLPYTRVLAKPFGGFALGYLAIVLFFSLLYWAIFRATLNGAPAFQGTPNAPTFFDFFVYSCLTIATLSANLLPGNNLVRIISALEVVIGVAWVTVMFASVLAYVQPRFTALAAGLRERGT